MVKRLNLSVVPASLVPYLNSQRPSYRDSSPTSEKCSELRTNSKLQLGNFNPVGTVTRDFSPASEPPASYRDFGSVPSVGITGNFYPISKAAGYKVFRSHTQSYKGFQSSAQISELRGISVPCPNQGVAGNFSSMLKPVIDFSPMSE